MKDVIALILLLGLLAGCARTTSAPDTTASERNNAGRGLHIGLGSYISDSGVWNLPPAASKP
jgi:hypothetical protein